MATLQTLFSELKRRTGVRNFDQLTHISPEIRDVILGTVDEIWRQIPAPQKDFLNNSINTNGRTNVGFLRALTHSRNDIRQILRDAERLTQGLQPRVHTPAPEPVRSRLNAVAEEFHPKTSYPMPNIERRQREAGMTDVEPDYEGTKAMPTSRASLARAPGV